MPPTSDLSAHDGSGGRFVPYRPLRPSAEDSRARADALLAELDGRRSVRFFSPDPVPRVLIERAIQTASTAPSGAHKQPWTFVAVSDPAVKRAIREGAEKEEYESYVGGRMPDDWRDAIKPMGTTWQKPFLQTAPWIVVCFAQSHGIDARGEKEKHYYVTESCGIACGLFIAALHHMGLCTLTHTPSPMRFLGEILDRPRHERPFMLFPVGFAAPDCVVPDLRRKELAEVSVFVEEGR